MFSNPSRDQMRDLLASLKISDPEHPDVSVTHESGWCLSAYPSGLLVWENVEDGTQPKHMAAVPADQVLRMWLALAAGDIAWISRFEWRDGYGSESAA